MRKGTLLIVLAITMLLFSCAKQPTTLRMVLTILPESFDALNTDDRFSTVIQNNIFEPLFHFVNADLPHNILIDYFYFTQDTMLVVKCKENVKFSDGTHLVAEDIIESIFRYCNQRVNQESFDITNIVANNNNTISIYLNKANYHLFDISYFSFIPIYKAAYIREFNEATLAKNPLGTGPYYLYSANETKIVLKKNHYYRDFAAMGSNPDIVEYYFEPNLHSQYLMIKANEADFILDLEFADYADAVADPNIVVYTQLSDYYSYLALDTMSPYKHDINLQTNPLRDKRVRQAIAHSINMQQYITDELLGQAVALAIPAPVQTREYPASLDCYEYNLDLAKDLLAQAGIPNGFKMDIYSSYGFYSVRLAEFIQKSLTNINILTTIKYFDGNELYQAILKTSPGSYIDIYSHNQALTPIYNFVRVHMQYSPRRAIRPNYFKQYNTRINAILDSLTTENIDINRINDLKKTLVEAVYDEVMLVPLFQPYVFHAVRKGIVWNSKKNHIPLAIEFEMR